MRTLFLMFVVTSLLLTACQSDQTVKQDLTGTWDVRIRLADEPKEEIEKELSVDVRTEIQEEFDSAKKEIREAFEEESVNITINKDGEETKIGSEQLVSGLEKMMDGLATMVEGLANLGTSIAEAITENLVFQATLESDGSIRIDSESDDIEIDISGQKTQWSVEDGKFVLSGDGDDETFTIVPTDTGYELVGEEVVIMLSRIED